MPKNAIGFVRRSLGRDYPADIQSSIQALSKSLDDMMAAAPNLATFAGTDLSGKVSELNARLTNDVILPSDVLSDDDARSRLLDIQKDAAALQAQFAQAGVTPGAGNSTSTAGLGSKEAQDLAAQMEKAFNLYTGIADRFNAASTSIQSALALPGQGSRIQGMVADLGSRLRSIDGMLDDMHQASDALSSAIDRAPSGAPVSVDRATVGSMQDFIGAVNQADEALKRIEAIVLRKPVEPTPAAVEPPSNTPWVLVGAAGVTLVGLAFWAATSGGKK